MIIELQSKYGNQWAKITKALPGRSDNAVKNRWNTAMGVYNNKNTPKDIKTEIVNTTISGSQCTIVYNSTSQQEANIPRTTRHILNHPNLSLLEQQPSNHPNDEDPITNVAYVAYDAYSYSHRIHDHQAYNNNNNNTNRKKGSDRYEESSSDVSEADQYDLSKYLPSDIYKKYMNPSIKPRSNQKTNIKHKKEKDYSESEYSDECEDFMEYSYINKLLEVSDFARILGKNGNSNHLTLKRSRVVESKQYKLNFLIIEDSIVQRKIIVKRLKLLENNHRTDNADSWNFGEVLI